MSAPSQNIIVQRATFLAPAAPNPAAGGKARALRRKEKNKIKVKQMNKKKFENGCASVKELLDEAERLDKAAAVEEEEARKKRARAAKLRVAAAAKGEEKKKDKKDKKEEKKEKEEEEKEGGDMPLRFKEEGDDDMVVDK
ncbi:hypothetical protein BO79DRAFT_262318 [Aspergillus costaricaensis CBS 115574]|uniref:Uncharacterized protein n=1 Tax=Aspergillus costaricaensis CBS 115574 TaxID=1448317 RepID=A0ACD1IK03_9EURO|nr:hypothetical protein BO79DRAFT_262318 [Aspergillus costaricaensis CBS 115574]RAK90571.1 hypothetical protein BO79DRAFT_262318 [Aspergillus costaricaensis CBS 115574]